MRRKFALIIGNNDYLSNPLNFCVNDATSLYNAFKTVENCKPELQTNLKSDDMYDCIKEFTSKIQPDDFVIFYFSGHGVQWGDQNFLLPCNNKKITSGDDMQRFAINAQWAVDRMAAMNPHIVLVLLDCCRNYWLPEQIPNTKSVNSNTKIIGLHQMNAPPQTLIAFACRAGDIVPDQWSNSDSGLFSKCLIKHMLTPNVDIIKVLIRVTNEVTTISNNSQRPYQVSSLTSEDIYFVEATTKRTEKSTIFMHSRPSASSRIISTPKKQEINIVLLGPTGVGRTTFINGFANYLVNDTFDDAINDDIQMVTPFCLVHTDFQTLQSETICVGKKDEYENVNDFGESWTQKCRSFVFQIGDRILRLIDTPAMGDTRGCEKDIENLNEIITYITQYQHLNGICIILKSNEERLTLYFRYCIQQLFNYLPVCVAKNLMFIFTNGRTNFFSPSTTSHLLENIIETVRNTKIPFSQQNSFILDNEGIRCLAKYHQGISLEREETAISRKSWAHTVKEYTRLFSEIISRPASNVRDMISLYEVQQYMKILTKRINELTLMRQNDQRRQIRAEEIKIENVYKKFCKFFQTNVIIPYNEDIIEYIECFITEQVIEGQAGANNQNVINRLTSLKSTCENEISLIKQTIHNDINSTNKIDLIQVDDIVPLINGLYELPISGSKIRFEVEQFYANRNKKSTREKDVKLPSKAATSTLTRKLK